MRVLLDSQKYIIKKAPQGGASFLVENTVPIAIGRTGAFPKAFGTL
ncbi:hypothetical protein ACFOWS_11460 [Flagellimonas marina]|uniref:Uncharacterized protein n=1 Tax=Flagellimonas marina TaxID=1775168 RepID=A0ABV8PLC6_9FLAO